MQGHPLGTTSRLAPHHRLPTQCPAEPSHSHQTAATASRLGGIQTPVPGMSFTFWVHFFMYVHIHIYIYMLKMTVALSPEAGSVAVMEKIRKIRQRFISSSWRSNPEVVVQGCFAPLTPNPGFSCPQPCASLLMVQGGCWSSCHLVYGWKQRSAQHLPSPSFPRAWAWGPSWPWGRLGVAQPPWRTLESCY